MVIGISIAFQSAHVGNAGLNVVQIFGGFSKEPFDSQASKNIILYCQKST